MPAGARRAGATVAALPTDVLPLYDNETYKEINSNSKKK